MWSKIKDITNKASTMRRKSLFNEELSRSRNLPDDVMFLSRIEEHVYEN